MAKDCPASQRIRPMWAHPTGTYGSQHFEVTNAASNAHCTGTFPNVTRCKWSEPETTSRTLGQIRHPTRISNSLVLMYGATWIPTKLTFSCISFIVTPPHQHKGVTSSNLPQQWVFPKRLKKIQQCDLDSTFTGVHPYQPFIFIAFHISRNHCQMPQWYEPQLATRSTIYKNESHNIDSTGLLPAKKCNSLSWTQTHRSEAEEQKMFNVYSWFIHLNWHQLNKQL